jgi:hypothetical protein
MGKSIDWKDHGLDEPLDIPAERQLRIASITSSSMHAAGAVPQQTATVRYSCTVLAS